MSKIIGIDTETAGLDAKRHGIIQIGMFIDIDGKLEDTLLVNVQPFDADILKINDIEFEYEDIAFIDKIKPADVIEPSGITIRQIVGDHIMPQKALKQIITFLDKYTEDKYKKDKKPDEKFYLMGFNLQFDMGFMAEWFRKLDFKYFGSYTNYRPLDAYHEACFRAYQGKLDSQNLKLETLCKHYGIEIEAHNALSDILATRQLWYRLTSRL